MAKLKTDKVVPNTNNNNNNNNKNTNNTNNNKGSNKNVPVQKKAFKNMTFLERQEHVMESSLSFFKQAITSTPNGRNAFIVSENSSILDIVRGMSDVNIALSVMDRQSISALNSGDYVLAEQIGKDKLDLFKTVTSIQEILTKANESIAEKKYLTPRQQRAIDRAIKNTASGENATVGDENATETKETAKEKKDRLAREAEENK